MLLDPFTGVPASEANGLKIHQGYADVRAVKYFCGSNSKCTEVRTTEIV